MNGNGYSVLGGEEDYDGVEEDVMKCSKGLVACRRWVLYGFVHETVCSVVH